MIGSYLHSEGDRADGGKEDDDDMVVGGEIRREVGLVDP